MDYRNLTVWRKAVDAAVEAHRLGARLPPEAAHALRPALERAAVAAAAAIAGGWSMDVERERGRLLAAAQGSLAEAETLLLLCVRLRCVGPDDARPLQTLLEDSARMLSSLRRVRRLQRESAARRQAERVDDAELPASPGC